uniref:Uncharacterized protein n=1 Tax=Anguilla anguilla TaxID=7936 RepID=A0A0E9WY95_ANGAN
MDAHKYNALFLIYLLRTQSGGTRLLEEKPCIITFMLQRTRIQIYEIVSQLQPGTTISNNHY